MDDLMRFFDQMEECIGRISVESGRDLVDQDDLLLEAEILFARCHYSF